MFIVGMLSWWYGAGWRQRMMLLREHIAGIVDYFSIDLLLRTLFSPFRQIGTGSVTGPLGVQIRAFFDRLTSRVIGMMVRSTMIIVGTIGIAVYACIGAVFVVLWACVPLLPIIGLILTLTGWLPWNR
jgi:hypothetical protein